MFSVLECLIRAEIWFGISAAVVPLAKAAMSRRALCTWMFGGSELQKWNITRKKKFSSFSYSLDAALSMKHWRLHFLSLGL